MSIFLALAGMAGNTLFALPQGTEVPTQQAVAAEQQDNAVEAARPWMEMHCPCSGRLSRRTRLRAGAHAGG